MNFSLKYAMGGHLSSIEINATKSKFGQNVSEFSIGSYVAFIALRDGCGKLSENKSGGIKTDNVVELERVKCFELF